MTTVTVAEFYARASKLLRSVEAGATVVVERDGKAIARMTSGTPIAPVIQTDTDEEDDDEITPDIFAGDFDPQPLTEFRFGSVMRRLEPMEPEVNLSWFPQRDDEETES